MAYNSLVMITRFQNTQIFFGGGGENTPRHTLVTLFTLIVVCLIDVFEAP